MTSDPSDIAADRGLTLPESLAVNRIGNSGSLNSNGGGWLVVLDFPPF
jgi:hypothetical protein